MRPVAANPGQIFFMDLASLKIGLQFLQGGKGGACQEDAAGFQIQAVRWRWPKGQMGIFSSQAAGEGVEMATAVLNRQAGGLIKGPDAFIALQQGRRKFWAWQVWQLIAGSLRQFLRKWRQADAVACLDKLKWFAAFAVEANLASAQPAVEEVLR